MAITRIKSSNINADAVNSEHLVDGSVDDAHLATDIDAGKLINALPALDGSNLTGVAPTKTTVEALGIELPAANLTGDIAGARLPDPLPAISGASLTNLPAANLTGTVATARLGSGTANSSTVLYGDQTYKAEPTTDLTAPGAIGGTTPAAGTFTKLEATSGLLGHIGGGVIVAAANSTTGNSADDPNFKVDFTVPVGNVATAFNTQLTENTSTGETRAGASIDGCGSGILIATCQGNYYWGFATKIYHLTVYSHNTTLKASSLNLLHSYSGQGHVSNASHVTLAVQSISSSATPVVRATFGGDFWASNRLLVTWIGHSVSSPSMIRGMTSYNSNWTGQDSTWK
jgi:hypothetical protein